MKYIFLIIGLGIGVLLGTVMGRRTKLNSKQSEDKEKNLEKIMDRARVGNITNDDVQGMLGVSDATAERYLHELEQAGRLEQVGDSGHYVFYKIKD